MQNTSLVEPIKKRVGGSLARLSPLRRLEILRANAHALRGGWSPPADDGTVVRKVVGLKKPKACGSSLDC
jgi:hypothetical protein